MEKQNRKALYDSVNLAGRDMSASSVMFHSAMAEKFGLTVTDWRAWDLVIRHGPLTAGRLAKLTGMTPGAATGLIDRLVAAGVVRRLQDAMDRRKVLVESVTAPGDQQRRGALFAPLLKANEKLYARYSASQLRTIADFMTRMSAVLRSQMAGLRKESSH
jgi:DNA-binding MarR family transcriptional regulator